LSEVSVIGLGAMGSAIAKAFIASGHDVTVWNRSPDKMLYFTESGTEATGGGRLDQITAK